MGVQWRSATKCLTSEATAEGYSALYVAIYYGVTPEQAFEILTDGRPNRKNPSRKINARYTIEDYRIVKELREKGMAWKDIGELYGASASGMYHNYIGWQRRWGNE